MPVITRSMARRPPGRSSTLEHAKSHPSSKPSSAAKKRYHSIKIQGYLTSSSLVDQRLCRTRRSSLPPQQSLKRTRKNQASSLIKQSSTTPELSSPDLPGNAITHYPCAECSCPQGAFEFPVDACIRCGHSINEHTIMDLLRKLTWGVSCDFVCERPELIASILQLTLIHRVVVIRATPQVGKTTLLRLLGQHILDKQKDLEPVFMEWKPRIKRDFLSYEKYLANAESKYREMNSEFRPTNGDHRPRNFKTKTIFLIDEAQDSYEEEEFWTQLVKNHNTRDQSLFVLVCLSVWCQRHRQRC